MASDQRAGGGHPDEHRAGPLADGATRLLAEGGVGLVADHDRVRVRDLARVAHEPLVGLDRHGAARRRLAAAVLEQRRRDALLVAARAQLAEELVDQVAPVGEDQDAAGARGLHEAESGHGLARSGGVLEPEAAVGARVLALGLDGSLLLGLLGRVPIERLLVRRLLLGLLRLAGLVLVIVVGAPRPPRRRRRLVVLLAQRGLDEIVLVEIVALQRGLAAGRPLAAATLPLPLRRLSSSSEVSAISVPDRAST